MKNWMKSLFACLGIAALLVLGGERVARADDNTCDACVLKDAHGADVKGAAEECLAAFAKPAACIKLTLATNCSPDSQVVAKTLDGQPIAADKQPFSAKCEETDKKSVTVTADPQKLKPFSAQPITVEVAGISLSGKLPNISDTKATPDKTKGSTTTDPPKPQNPPVDIDPATPMQSAKAPEAEDLFKDGEGKDGTRIIYVHENFAIDARSAKFVTESDRVVIRFIARQAVLCRYYAVADDKNEYKPQIGRVGGQEGLSTILKGGSLVGYSEAGQPPPPVLSCGKQTENGDGPGRLTIKGGEDQGDTYASVDFIFGPFTNDQLTFHLFRHDRVFSGNDMQGDIKIANHQRYVGWVDVMVLASFLKHPNQDISVVPENGTELTRINVSEEYHQIDVAAQVKFFAHCWGEGVNPWFQPQDLAASSLCIGLGSGFSLLHPTERFYPIGFNITIARYLSLNSMLILERTKELASGYNSGDVFSGSASDVPTNTRLTPGLALGVGIDPTLVGALVGQIVKAGL